MADTSTKPYLIRALYEWCCDNGYTPYLAVAVDHRSRVPRQHVKNGEIVMNVSPLATNRLELGNEFVSFQARFGGVAQEIAFPVDSVSAIYARETGHGMAFEVTREADDAPSSAAPPPGPRSVTGGGGRGAHLVAVDAGVDDDGHADNGSALIGRDQDKPGDASMSSEPSTADAAPAGGEVIAFRSPASRRSRPSAPAGGDEAEPGEAASAPKPLRSSRRGGKSASKPPADGVNIGDGAAEAPVEPAVVATPEPRTGDDPPDDGGGSGGGATRRGPSRLTRVK